MKILLCSMGMESVKKNLRHFYLYFKETMQARPYTEDFEKILFQATYHPSLGLWRSHWSYTKSDSQPLQGHCVLLAGEKKSGGKEGGGEERGTVC